MPKDTAENLAVLIFENWDLIAHRKLRDGASGGLRTKQERIQGIAELIRPTLKQIKQLKVLIKENQNKNQPIEHQCESVLYFDKQLQLSKRSEDGKLVSVTQHESPFWFEVVAQGGTIENDRENQNT